MDSSSSELEPIERLAEEFVERQRRGERPSLEEYTERHPELESEIRDVFPALVMMEQVAPAASDLKSSPKVEPTRKQIGDYRILREIGRGGMGVVYEAEQQSLHRRVALKVLPLQMVGGTKLRQRFQQEARAAARMHHTNIVPVFEVGQDQETAFYAMQLIQGQSLDLVIDDLNRLRQQPSAAALESAPQQVFGGDNESAAPSIAGSLISGNFVRQDFAAEERSKGELHESSALGLAAASMSQVEPTYSETVEHAQGSTVSAALPGQSDISTAESNRLGYFRSVAQIGLQTAGALAYAHAHGVIHRDIKPSNLLLDAAGVVWVTDFGLAKTGEHGLTHTGDVLGTLRYMSPERFQARCDVRADIYAVGLTLYEMLVLKPAFDSPDRLKLVETIRQLEPAVPRSIDPGIPRDLETIVLKSIDKDPKRRYQSADELAEDLRRFVDDEPINARRLSPAERLLRWSRRNKGMAASLTAIAVLLVTVVVGAVLAATHFRGMAQANTALARQRSYERNKAVAARQEEERLRRLAEHRERTATAMRLAAESSIVRDTLPVQAALLAVEAAEVTRRHDGKALPRAHEALLSATQNLGGVPLIGHKGRVEVVQISPDGQWLLTAGGTSPDGEARLWDLSAPDPAKSPKILPGHRHKITSAVYSPDGRWLVTCSLDKTARLWDLTTAGIAPSSLVLDRHEEVIRSAAISPDSRWLVTGSEDHTVRRWDLNDQDPGGSSVVLRGHSGSVRRVLISPDGRRLITAGIDKTVRLWDLNARNPAELQVLSGHDDGIVSAAISSEGDWLVTGSEDGTARLWPLAARDPASLALVFPHKGAVPSVAISADGRWLATGNEETARIWDLAVEDPTAKPYVLRGHTSRIQLAISPDSRWLVTAGRDFTARLWDLTKQNPADSSLELRAHEDNVSSIAFSPDSRRLATASWDGTVRLWDLAADNPASSLVLRGHEDSITSLKMIADQGWLVTASRDGTARLWSFTAADRYPVILSRVLKGHLDTVSSCGVTGDGRWLVTGSWDGTARLWNLVDRTASPQLFPGNGRRIVSVAISPDGRWIVTGDDDTTARLWDLTDATPVPQDLPGYQAHQIYPMSRLTMSPDGHWLVTARSRRSDPEQKFEIIAHLWDLTAQNPVASPLILRAPNEGISSLAFSRDSRWLATGSWDGTTRVWDLGGDQASPIQLHGHREWVVAVAISPNNRWLVSGSWDDYALARLWDLRAQDPASSAVELAGHTSALFSAAISPDGRWLVTGAADKTARVWDLTADNPTESSLVLRGHEDAVHFVDVSPDSRWVITGSRDTTVRLWDLDIDALIQRARRLAGRELTLEERRQYMLAP